MAANLKANVRPRDMKPDEEVVYDVCMNLSTKHAISDDVLQGQALLGEQQLVDLVAISGTYVSVAMLLSLGEENSPADQPIPFPETVRSAVGPRPLVAAAAPITVASRAATRPTHRVFRPTGDPAKSHR